MRVRIKHLRAKVCLSRAKVHPWLSIRSTTVTERCRFISEFRLSNPLHFFIVWKWYSIVLEMHNHQHGWNPANVEIPWWSSGSVPLLEGLLLANVWFARAWTLNVLLDFCIDLPSYSTRALKFSRKHFVGGGCYKRREGHVHLLSLASYTIIANTFFCVLYVKCMRKKRTIVLLFHTKKCEKPYLT